ncbi:MAG: hypothetical protein JXA89_16800 [Anaerolineae bacterium]|nr:hypothetical protein [Anaerolineae bacterium]
MTKEEWRWAATCAVGLALVALLPYLVAYLATPSTLFYTGFLSNPQDGNTYLAKMQQGMRGAWLFHLPYTPEPHDGEFLFTYYLFLGHVARWTRLPPIVLFHAVRTINGIGLLLVLYYTASVFFSDRAQRQFAFWIIATGSGFGWLATLLGHMTADTWVPEGYIFYSLFVNPHFPLAIAMMLLLIVWSVTPWGERRLNWRRWIGLGVCTAVLALVQPFCLLSVGVVLLVYTAVHWIRQRRLPWREIVSGMVIAFVGLPFVVNGYLSTTQNPLLAAWSAQNVTLSPPLWDYALSYGPVLLLALPGMWAAIRRRRDGDVLLFVWTACVLVLLYIPYSLQRRLVMGLIVPLGLLAAIGWYHLPRRVRRWRLVVYVIASLTHVFILAVSLVGALAHHESLFIAQDEYAALRWLDEHSAYDALIVASPQTGLYIPAWIGRRVFYGHRFETANAELREAQLEAFYREGDPALLRENPDYVFYGPRERRLHDGTWRPDPAWQPVFQQGDVIVYAIP